jgi:hypothetical protein
MRNNALYAVIIVLVVAVVGLAVAYNNERSKTSGIHIDTKNGLTIEHKE